MPTDHDQQPAPRVEPGAADPAACAQPSGQDGVATIAGLKHTDLIRKLAQRRGHPGSGAGDGGGDGGGGRGGGGHKLTDDMLMRMERAYGISLGDVMVREDSDRAGGSVHAVTEGDQVHFAPGRYQPGTPEGDRLIAHELAHVAQQRGGAAKEARSYATGAPSTDALEAEADQAAERAVAGDRIGVRLSATPGAPQRYEAHEHRQIGRTGGGGRKIMLDCGIPIGFEDAMWMAGDLYGSVEALKRAPAAEVRALLRIVKLQEDKAREGGGRPSPEAQAELDAQFQEATVGRERQAYDAKTHGPTGQVKGEVEGAEKDSFQTLATKNDGHFSTLNMKTWETSHRAALKLARAAHADPTHCTSLLNDALLHDAFGAHFLTDAFASGHLVSGNLGRQLSTIFFDVRGADVKEAVVAAALADPTALASRVDLQARLTQQPAPLRAMIAKSYSVAISAASMMDKIDDLLLKTVHDQLNQEGLAVRNRRGDGNGGDWKTTGDLALHTSPRTMALASEAVRLSRTEVEEAAATGRDPGESKAPLLVPDEVQVCGTWLPISEFSSRVDLFLGYLKALTLDRTPENRLYRLIKNNMAATLIQFASDHLERAAEAIGEGQLAEAESRRMMGEATVDAVSGGARFVAGAARAVGGALVGKNAPPDDPKLRDTGASGAERPDGGVQ